MKEKRSLWIILAVVSVVALVAVGWTVVKKASPEPLEGSAAEEAPTAAEETPESNKVVLDETRTSSGEVFKAVSGKVVSVSDRVLVLEVGGDRLQILVALDAKITRTVLPAENGQPQVTEIDLEEIQNGQQVDALVEVKEGRAMTTNLNLIVGL